MKSLNKVILFASLLAIGTGITSIPAVTGTVQAASNTSTFKNKTPDGFYYRVGKNELVKASDIKIVTKNDQSDADMIETDTPNDFRLVVTTPKTSVYNLKGKKLTKHLSEGTVYSIGNQDEFTQITYYKSSKDKIVQVNDSTWL
ncbi:hypothetical protein ACFQAV_01120 [Companilactobacillus huachuanensis]|uniref:Surface layer protein A domain-containing protein n=1 Tax=Companilactobacillus huachuanensis TaxID=2559914 RepID=A0ABW1RH94_9LACO|nr:hypothetical protein [Companilactobacillus huachuanensis]